MRKKHILLSFLLAVLLLLSSCALKGVVREEALTEKNNNASNSLTVDKSVKEPDVVPSPYYPSLQLTNGYDTLETDAQKTCYNEIYKHITDFTGEKDGDYYLMSTFSVEGCTLSKRQLAKVFIAFFQDNPQIFWLEETYAFSISDHSIDLRLYSIMPQSEYETERRRLNAVVNSILSGLREGMSQFDLELYIHDYLVKNCKYKKNLDNNTISPPYTAYGALVNQKAVCEGYTKAFRLLLSYVGINSVPVNGFGQNEEHVWSAVSIDSAWYYTDVTWDDAEDYCMYDYFNITEEQLKKDHSINPLLPDCTDLQVLGDENNPPVNCNIFIPECNDTGYNYYAFKGSSMTDISRNNLARDLAATAKSNSEYFHIYVDPEYMDYTMTYDQLFSDTLYGFLKYINEANSILGEKKLRTDVSVIKKKSLHTITVELGYN